MRIAGNQLRRTRRAESYFRRVHAAPVQRVGKSRAVRARNGFVTGTSPASYSLFFTLFRNFHFFFLPFFVTYLLYNKNAELVNRKRRVFP